jgi:hypothetical protein
MILPAKKRWRHNRRMAAHPIWSGMLEGCCLQPRDGLLGNLGWKCLTCKELELKEGRT